MDRWKRGRAEKRGGGQLPLALEELTACVPAADNVAEAMEALELSRVLDSFLRKLPEKECCIFLRRYWYLDSAQTIARRFHMTEGSVKSQLFRTRTKLRAYLEKEGICL